jgi:hypothetical protein
MRPTRRPSYEDLHRLYVTENRTTREIGKLLGAAGRTVSLWLKEVGIQARSISEGKKGRPPARASVEASVRARRKRSLPGRPNVGYKLNDDGYVLLYMPGHPMVEGSGYVKEHRLVLSQKLGRLLERHEDGHHLNHVRHDNDPDNLELKDSRVEHQREHSATRARRSNGTFAPEPYVVRPVPA